MDTTTTLTMDTIEQRLIIGEASIGRMRAAQMDDDGSKHPNGRTAPETRST